MQRRMKLWGKEQVVNLAQRASLYKAIDRLHDAGLIAVRETQRDQRFPERTIYELTDVGWRTGHEWLIDMLSTPRNEFPQFPAALSFIMGLTPDEALAVLERRRALLRDKLASLERAIPDDTKPLPPPVTLLDGEYLCMITSAELAWVSGVIQDLRSGKLTWSYEELAESARQFLQD
jgi:DNA-binding PadR family transcriptional regulator